MKSILQKDKMHKDMLQKKGLDQDDDITEITSKKTFRDYFLLNPNQKFLTFFDSLMLLVIAYSCFTTSYYIAFGFPSKGTFAYKMEFPVLFIFTLDIVFNFMREYRDKQNQKFVKDHSKII